MSVILLSVDKPPALKSRLKVPGWYITLLLLALSLSPTPALAAPPVRKPATPATSPPRHHLAPRPLPPDHATALPPRRPDRARLRALAAEPDFRYTEPDTNAADAWDAFWARLGRWLSGLLGTRTGRFTWKYGLYTAMLAALVFAVLKLLQVDITGAFGRAGRRGALLYDTTLEDIHQVDFPTRLAEAEAAGNFRLATRLGYLEVLKHLTDRDLIHWQPDKTNHAYLAELLPGPLQAAFDAATREFEYVWYGELRLSQALYQQARATQRAVSGQLTPVGAGRARVTTIISPAQAA